MLQNNEKLIKELTKELGDKILIVITDGLSQKNKSSVNDKYGIYKQRNAVDPEDEEFNVPKGKIYVGHEQFISEKHVKKIEENVFRFTTRVDKLCNLIWENESIMCIVLRTVKMGNESLLTSLKPLQTFCVA